LREQCAVDHYTDVGQCCGTAAVIFSDHCLAHYGNITIKHFGSHFLFAHNHLMICLFSAVSPIVATAFTDIHYMLLLGKNV